MHVNFKLFRVAFSKRVKRPQISTDFAWKGDKIQVQTISCKRKEFESTGGNESLKIYTCNVILNDYV